MATYTIYAVMEEYLDGHAELVRAFPTHAEALYYARRATADNADRGESYSFFPVPVVLEADVGLPFMKF